MLRAAQVVGEGRRNLATYTGSLSTFGAFDEAADALMPLQRIPAPETRRGEQVVAKLSPQQEPPQRHSRDSAQKDRNAQSEHESEDEANESEVP